jgi:hypothetical protein
LTVVLFGNETWSVILREEHRLKVSEDMVLRKVFGPERVTVIGERGQVPKEELHDCLPL